MLAARLCCTLATGVRPQGRPEGREEDLIMTGTSKRPLTMDEAIRPAATEAGAGVDAWHDEQTRQAIREADAGEFATFEEVKAAIRKFVPHDG